MEDQRLHLEHLGELVGVVGDVDEVPGLRAINLFELAGNEEASGTWRRDELVKSQIFNVIINGQDIFQSGK